MPEQQNELVAVLAADPEAITYYALFELENGRLQWLAEHIRQRNFQIDELVAMKLLELIEGSHPVYRLTVSRSQRLNPKQRPRLETDTRDVDLAFEVARRGGFKRGMQARVCHEVGEAQTPKLKGSTVQKLVRRHREFALLSLGMAEPCSPGGLETGISKDA